MAIPLKYNLRSLLVRRTGTAMAVISVAATVAVFVSVMALVEGLESVFAETGHPLNLVVIRQGSQVETNSSLPVPALQTLKYLPGIQKDGSGEPLVSAELLVLIFIPRASGDETHVILRGITPAGFLLREQVRLVEGRAFRSSLQELVCSRRMARRFGLGLGSTIRLGPSEWQVVGLTEAGGALTTRNCGPTSVPSPTTSTAAGFTPRCCCGLRTPPQRLSFPVASPRTASFTSRRAPNRPGDLDAQSASEVLEIFGRLNRDFGKTIVLVTHDARAARYARYARIVRHLDKGVPVEQ